MFTKTFLVYLFRIEAICGCNVLDLNWKPPARTIFCIIFTTLYGLFCFYTIATYDIDTKSKCLTWVGISLQGVVKFYTVIIYPAQMREMILFLQHIHTVNPDPTTANYKSLKENAAISLNVMKFGAMVVCSGCAFFTPVTWLSNYLHDEREFALPIFVPFVDESTTIGFVITNIFHVIALFMAACGLSASDMRLVLFVLHLRPMSAMFSNTMEEMNQGLLVERNRHSEEMRKYFRNLILMHLEFCNYLKRIVEIYSPTIFVEVYSDALSLCFIQYCILSVSYAFCQPEEI